MKLSNDKNRHLIINGFPPAPKKRRNWRDQDLSGRAWFRLRKFVIQKIHQTVFCAIIKLCKSCSKFSTLNAVGMLLQILEQRECPNSLTHYRCLCLVVEVSIVVKLKLLFATAFHFYFFF